MDESSIIKILSGRKLSELHFLPEPELLEILELEDCNMDAPEVFSRLPNLRELTFNGVALNDLQFLPELYNLEELHINGDIGSLQGISRMPCLQKLWIYCPLNKQALDLSPLSGMDSLRQVTLHTDFIDVSGIPALNSLEELDLHGLFLKGTGALAHLHGLKKLAWVGEPDGLDFLPQLTNLETLAARADTVDKLPSLSALDSLHTLSFNGKKLDISGLSGLRNLRRLYLSLECLQNSGVISGFGKLEKLSINLGSSTGPLGGYFPLDSPHVNFLSGLSRLKNLKITAGNLSDIKGLCGLEELEYLSLASVVLQNLEPLAALKGLEVLELRGAFDDITPLAQLHQLRSLHLKSASLSNIECIAGLENLEELEVKSSGVDLNGLESLSRLKTLQIDR